MVVAQIVQELDRWRRDVDWSGINSVGMGVETINWDTSFDGRIDWELGLLVNGGLMLKLDISINANAMAMTILEPMRTRI